MPRHRPPYPAEFRRQLVELVPSGRTPEELSREFEPSAQAGRGRAADLRIVARRVTRTVMKFDRASAGDRLFGLTHRSVFKGERRRFAPQV